MTHTSIVQKFGKRIIVNADDFGFSDGATEGILRSHLRGVVTSTTIAANMPAAASAIGRLAEAPRLGVGVHLNVSQGPPLSKEGLRLAGPDGMMNLSAVGVITGCVIHTWMLDAIEAEFDAQIRWALDHGVLPTHLDSHRHSHGFTPVFARVAALARRYDIPFVRRHREHLPGGGWPSCPLRQRRISELLNVLGEVNRLIAGDLFGTLGVWGVRHTGQIDAGWLAKAAQQAPPGVVEIMVHPAAGDDMGASMTRLRQSRLAETEALCSPEVRRAFEENGIELIHYGQL